MLLPPIEILLVEDSPPDVRWFQIIVADLGLPHRITVMADGDDALSFLENAESPRPMWILLDINLPRVDGNAVLERISELPELASIPVCMLTGSRRERELIQSRFGIPDACYLEKPVSAEALMGALLTFESLRIYLACSHPPNGTQLESTSTLE